MRSATDDMIAALDAFVPHPQALDDERRLYQITSTFGDSPDAGRAIPAMFSLMERCPYADLGAPGPLVHCMESLGIPSYEPELVASVQRRPMYLNLVMVARILGSVAEPAHRDRLIALLRGTRQHPAWAEVAEIVEGFLAPTAARGVG